MESIDHAEPPYAEPQRQVQRWLGRCMLSLQQSERFLKAVLHDAEVTAVHSGRAGDGAAVYEESRAFKKERLASMTLGGLVSAFFGEVVSDTEAPSEGLKEPALPDDRFSVRFSFRVSLSSQTFEKLQASMREMVSLRNEWVHHLVDRFNLTSVEGCAQALEHLQTGYETAERFRLEIQGIAKVMVEHRRSAAEFFASPAGRAAIFGEKIPLESTSLFHALRGAMDGVVLNDDGTVPLSELLEKLRSSHPDEMPENYGYASWQQVIHESRIFGMVRRDPEGRKITPRVRFNGSSAQGM
ncbi:OST-HTH/LOTUS domain-containing protein [Paracidovorax sp. MALMAid1276]|uniref:OST-HTH/LOTUS domain-containing protein n=1 Tax=Paracidovorax sp. MALMAid1276 TaxID=3411631 RepID=UPI003B994833